jgi:hypothetical protein
MEYWWNDVWWENPKCSEKNLLQFYLVNHKPHTDFLGIDHGPP